MKGDLNNMPTGRNPVYFMTADIAARAYGDADPWINANPSLKQKKPPKDKVIFNPPATILYIKGKKYVSKAHDEKFDEEKGLLMCIAKAYGITHLELKRMIKNASRPQEKK